MRIIKMFGFFLLFALSVFGQDSDYWNASNYDKNSFSQRSAAYDLMQFITINNDDRILDVGCGDGLLSSKIADRVILGSVVGVDVSDSMIDFAKAAYKEERDNLYFLKTDAIDLKFHDEFDKILSFTSLQWFSNHALFVQNAKEALKERGTLAFTAPMGLPLTLKVAVEEIMEKAVWKEYFTSFSTGWNFPEKQQFQTLLTDEGFDIERLEVVRQVDVFPSREQFYGFLFQIFPYLRVLPDNLKEVFLNQVIDRFLILQMRTRKQEVLFVINRLEVVATKRES